MPKFLDRLDDNESINQEPINNSDNSLTGIIQKLHDVIRREDWQSKGDNIDHNNVKGMIQANSFNNFLEESLGKEFRITLLDKLIFDKMTFTLSVKGVGTKKIQDGLNTIQPVINSNVFTPPTFMESLARDGKQIKR